MYTKQEIILRKIREGKSQRQISGELGISRRTVKKYLEEYEEYQKTFDLPYEMSFLRPVRVPLKLQRRRKG